jgi:hypothetical protein
LFVVFLLGMLFSRVIGSNLIEGDENENERCGVGAEWYNDFNACRCNGYPDAKYDSNTLKCICPKDHVYRKSSGYCYPQNCNWDDEKKECICPDGQKYDIEKKRCITLRSPDNAAPSDCVKWSDGCKTWTRDPIPFGYNEWKKVNDNDECEINPGINKRYPEIPFILENCQMDKNRWYDEEVAK